MVGLIEPMAMTNVVGAVSLPLEPGMAMGILVGSLVLAALSISLAVAPPTALLRCIRLPRAAERLRRVSATA